MVAKILVTGGAGFIGSHICHRLLTQGDEVVCLDNFDPYYDITLKRRNIAPFLINKNFKLIEGDICNQELVTRVISQDIDYIFHSAAQPGVSASISNPLKPHQVNATGLLNILHACRGSRVKKMISASSSSVYGRVKYLPFDENHPTMPISPYGVSKLIAEHYCRVFSALYGLKVTSLRLFTVYGPRMRPDLAVSIFTTKALKNEPITIFGDGNRTRDFTYVDDVVAANLLAMKKDDSEIYNIGSGQRISVSDLARKIIEITGSRSRIIHSQPRQGDAEHTWANVDKAKQELDWEPNFNLEQGLKKFIEWKRINEISHSSGHSS